MLKDIETAAKREYLPIIGPEKAAAIAKLIEDRQPCVVVEIGVLVGYATIAVAGSLGEGCTISGIEISGDLARRAEENVVRAGVAGKAKIIQGDAREVLSQMRGPVDTLIMDAERSQYLNYLKKIEEKLSPGALVIAVGTANPRGKISDYLDYVRKSERYESTTMVFADDAMEVSTFRG
jgi:predicted O-methyltransferase YrrM